MKYYHLIYNSSQRSQDGSAGLGVRTYTQGMPKEYITMLKENEFFGYASGSLAQPSPKTLFEDGNVILQYPATYRFARLFAPESGKEVFVLARTVSVGFDYPYYVKFAATRVDNFVVDAYIFEEFPDMETFEMLYEKPAEGNNCFVPKNPVPSPENEEMKTLSIGEMSLLEAEEKPFKCSEVPPVSDLSIELLFAYLEAQRTKFPLLVKCAAGEAPKLLADLLRLLPEPKRKEVFFYTNYQLEGLKEGFNVFFINEHYRYDYEGSGQFYVFDATRNPQVVTKEAELYRSQLATLFREGKIEEYSMLMAWISSETYNDIRDKSSETKRLLYSYAHNNQSFNFNDVFKGNDETLNALKAYFGKDKQRQALFDKQLSAYLASAKIAGNDLVQLLKFTDKLHSLGFDLNGVVTSSKKAVTEKLLASPEMLKSAIDSLGIGQLEKYLDKPTMERHKDFLKDVALRNDWTKIHKLFLTQSEQNNHVGILRMMFGFGLPESIVNEVIKGFGVDDLKQCDYLAEVAKHDPNEIDLPFKRIKDIIDDLEKRHMTLPDPSLAAKIEKYVLQPLAKDEERPNGLDACLELMQLLQGKFTKENANALFDRVLKIGTKQSASLLYANYWPFLEKDKIRPFVDEIVANVKPEKLQLVAKMEGQKDNWLELLSYYFKKTGETKKTIEKMKKDGQLRLSDENFVALMDNLFGNDKSQNSEDHDGDSKLKQLFNRFKIPVIAVGAVLVLGVAWLLMPKHDKDDMPVLNEVATGNIIQEGEGNTQLNESIDTTLVEVKNDTTNSVDSVNVNRVEDNVTQNGQNIDKLSL